jgi:hypothetical protein
MRPIFPRLLGLIVLGLACLGPLAAQEAAELPLAAISDGNVWLYSLSGSSRPLTSARPGEQYHDVVWSPNGGLLAFTGEMLDLPGTSLFVASESGGPALRLATGVHPLLPVGFSPDSVDVLYGQIVPEASTSTSDLVQLYRYMPQAGSAPVQLGAIDVVTACGQQTTPRLPTDARYAAETGRLGKARYLLAWTPFGILYSTSCNAPSLNLLSPTTGQTRTLFAEVESAFAAPDGTRAVAVVAGALAFINTESGPYTQIIPAAPPDQIGFGPDPREVFYSTRTLIGQTPLPGNAAQRLGSLYFQMPLSYHVQLRRFSLRSGRDDLLYEADAFGIGQIAVTADGSSVIFSQIPNADAWAQAVADGAAPDDTAVMDRTLPVTLYALSLGDASVTPLNVSARRFALNPAASVTYVPGLDLSPVPPTFTPIPLPPTATLPPTLTPPPEGFIAPTLTASGIGVGVPMRINPEVGTLNVRRRPGTGSPVVELMFGGEAVTVLAGPEDDLEGYRWWQVSVPSGAVGWVAERVNGVQTLIAP